MIIRNYRYGSFGDVASDMDAAIVDLAKTYIKGAAKIGFNPDALARLAIGPAGFLIPESEGEVTAKAEYKKLGTYMNKWATTYKRWALNGKRDDGTDYTLAMWKDFGRTLADSMTYISGVAWDDSYVATLPSSITKTIAATAKEITTPSLWPSWLKWGLAGVGLVAAAYVVNTARGTVRALRGRPA